MTAPQHRLAIYDLDRTITRSPTWTPFLLAAVWQEARWRLLLTPLVLGAAAAEAVGAISRRSLKQWMQRLALGRVDATRATRLAERFAERFGARHILAGARAAMAADRAAGFRIVIATASYDFYAEALARAVGADALIATRATRGSTGLILPLVDGENCYGAAKLAMIRAWMAAQGIDRAESLIRFYSDSRSDLPTFDWADEPIAVNAHRPLRRLARQRGWRSLVWK